MSRAKHKPSLVWIREVRDTFHEAVKDRPIEDLDPETLCDDGGLGDRLGIEDVPMDRRARARA